MKSHSKCLARPSRRPGISETELRREQIYYAADSVAEVWDAIQDLLRDPERSFVAIVEKLGMLVLITGNAGKKHG